MILSAAATHGIFIDDAQSGSGFTRVENACPRTGDCLYELARKSRDPAHALQEIQDHALAGENHARVVTDHRNRLPGPQPHAIENFRMRCDLVVRSDGSVESG